MNKLYVLFDCKEDEFTSVAYFSSLELAKEFQREYCEYYNTDVSDTTIICESLDRKFLDFKEEI